MTTITCYNFDNALEGATVYDDTGNHNGSVVGSVPLVDGPISSKQRTFPGVSGNYIQVPDGGAAAFKIDADWTIEIWVTPTSFPSYMGLVCKGHWFSTPSLEMLISGVNYAPYIVVTTNGSNYLYTDPIAANALSANVLYYLAATFKRSTKSLLTYKNGLYVQGTSEFGTYTGGDNTRNLLMGTVRDTLVYPFVGHKHALRWSNVVKTPKQIFDTYMAANVQET
jgi:hypothetical protein